MKLKEDSEAVVAGQRTAASISKKINMDSGTVRATVKKQNVDFVIQTPTSVASVKGTDFWLLSDPISGDEIIGLEGIVTLTNNETRKTKEANPLNQYYNKVTCYSYYRLSWRGQNNIIKKSVNAKWAALGCHD